MPKLLFINNGPLQASPSGGDKHIMAMAMEMAAHPVGGSVTVLLPEVARLYLHGGFDCTIRTYQSPFPQGLFGILATYARRIVTASRICLRCAARVTLGTGCLVDMIPMLVHRHKYKSKTVFYVFHLIPKRKAGSVVQYLQYGISYLMQQIALRLYRIADLIITDNYEVRDELVARGIEPGRIFVQYPAVNLNAIHEAVPGKAYDVLFAGRLVKQKGIYDLLDATRHFQGTVGIIGDGEERNRLERIITERGLSSRVTLLGAVPEKDVYGYMKACGVFVLPSYEEGYGMAIAEALACGRRVIAYEQPHYVRAFAGSVGEVPPGNTFLLGRRIRNWLAYKITADVKYPDLALRNTSEAAAAELKRIQELFFP